MITKDSIIIIIRKITIVIKDKAVQEEATSKIHLDIKDNHITIAGVISKETIEEGTIMSQE